MSLTLQENIKQIWDYISVGNRIYVDGGAPSTILGAVGDMYIDDTTTHPSSTTIAYNWYTKTDDALWVEKGNLSGQAVIDATSVDGVTIEFDVSSQKIRIKDAGVSTVKIIDDAIDKDKINADVAGNGLGQNVSGALEVNVDDSTIEINSDTLRVKDDGITGEKLHPNVAGAGLTQDASGNLDIETTTGSIVGDIDDRVDNLEANQVTGVETYATLAGLPGTGTLLVSYKVTNDGTSSNNGYYHWTGAAYVKDASLVLNTFDKTNTSDAFSGKAIYDNTNENNRLLLDAVPTWYSDYLNGSAKSELISPIILQNDGDYIEFKVLLRNLGGVASTAQSMGMCGEEGISFSTIGVFYSGPLYIKSSAGVWLTQDGFNDLVTIDGNEIIIRLEWTATEIKTYKNGIFQKDITKGDIIIENFGYAYNSTPTGSYNGLIRDIEISHSSGTIVNFDSPYFDTEDIENTNVAIYESEEVFLTELQLQQLEDNTSDIEILQDRNYSDCYVTYDPTGSTTGNELFLIYVKNQADDGTIYFKFTVAHDIDLSAIVYSDDYRLQYASVVSYNGSVMSSNIAILLNSGESESVYKTAGKSDFTGGFHGNELFTQIDFYIDKVRLTASELSSSFNLRACSEFLYVQKSTTHEAPTGGVPNPLHPIESLHDKWTIFRNSGYETRTRYTWQDSLSITVGYLSISSISVDMGEYAQSNNYNVVQFDRGSGNKLEEINDNAQIWNETDGYSIDIESEFDVFNDTSNIFIWDTPSYNKFYRNTGGQSVINGEVWNGKTIIKVLKA